MRALMLLLVLSFVGPAEAKSFASRTDLEIVALDAQTGDVKWTHAGTPLGNAHFELYPDLLVAYPHYDPRKKTDAMFLSPKTGAVVKDTRDPKRLVARSSAQWITEPIVLANGWRLDTFRQGHTKQLDFTNPKTGRVAWSVVPAHYPEYVRAYKDVLLVAYGYLTDEAVVFAYQRGAKKPAWTIDFNKLLNKPALKKSPQRLGRVTLQIIGDVLYAQTGEHVFAIAPATGKILWRLAAAALGIRYEPELYGGALDVAVFARDAGVLVVAFEKRLLALRAATGRILWSLEPDTFPHTAFPLVKNGIIYITAGAKRGKPKRST